VLDAINRLGPDLTTETPSPADAEFAAGVATLAQELAIPEFKAAVLHMIRCGLDDGPLRALADAVLAGGGPEGEGPEADWLRSLGAWFRTPA